jgi:polyol permease family
MVDSATRVSWLDRQGISRALSWGFVALLLFMVGDGIELGFLAPYLESVGFSTTSIAAMVTVYGVVAAVASWVASSVCEAWGPRRVMLFGFAVWVSFEIVFLGWGIASRNYLVMTIAYGIRGLGYPFFAFGFLVWVTMSTPESVLGRAVGWYWFAYTAGLGVISSYFAGLVIPAVGGLATLWLSMGFVVTGGLIAVFLLKEPDRPEKLGVGTTLRALASGLTIVTEQPKVGVAGLIKLVNALIFYCLPLFLASHLVNHVGFTLSQWQAIWGTMLLATLPGNLAAGYLGDKLGLHNVVAWFGGCLMTISVLGWYYVPQWFGPNVGALMVVSIVSGVGLGGYTPIAAIAALLAPRRKGAAVAVVNLGNGLSNAVGPALVGLLLVPLGAVGVIWVLAATYATSVPLTYVLRTKPVAAAGPSEVA